MEKEAGRGKPRPAGRRVTVRAGRAEEEMEALEAEVVSAEDKLACTLYTLKSNESLYARNLLGN